MNNQLHKFSDLITQFSQLTARPILMGVSGGIDSIVLLHLLVTHSCNIEIFHCNFSLRGEESEGDELFVKNLAEKYNIPCHIRKFDTAQFAADNGISLQMAARQLRIEFMNELFAEKKFSCICLAHHLDDNIETFFLNLIRGTGIRGLKGMSVLSSNILRPMLEFTRDEIREYVAVHHLEFREDSSNAKDDYLRNRVRHQIIPQIKKAFPGFQETMKENMKRFAEGVSLYNELISDIENDVILHGSDHFTIDLEKLKSYENHGALIGEILSKYGFSFLQSSKIAENAQKTETTQFESNTHIAWVKSGQAEIRKLEPKKNHHFSIESVADFHSETLPLKFLAQVVPGYDIPEFEKDPSYAFFDFSKVCFPLTLRKWKLGDTFRPFGMKGKKLLSDFFTDQKMTAVQKQHVFVLCSEDQILWVVGHRTDEHFRVNTSTEKVLLLQILK